MFENKVLRKIFGAKFAREQRKLHNVELYALYSSPNIIRNLKSRRLRWTGYVAWMKETRNADKRFSGKTFEEKRTLGRLRSRWKDNIKMDLKKVGCDAGN